MGDIADMMIDGILCQFCGEYLDGEVPGHPRTCAGCAAVEKKLKKKKQDDRDKQSSDNPRRW